MNIIKGNLITHALSGNADVIVHGCNCFCTMGAGIAVPMKNNFPEAYKADLATVKGDRQKLGRYSYANVIRNGFPITVINAYTQYRYGKGGPHADLQAIERVFKSIKNNFSGKIIAYPKIGSGYGARSWGDISLIIDEALAGENHYCVSLTGD